LTTITNGANITTYAYNAADRLPNVTATRVYNADRKRVKQTLGSAVTNYLWEGQGRRQSQGKLIFQISASQKIPAT